ncbi:MAG: hypothetical protein ACK41Y_05700 [Paracoccus hibiscisoli]|uniref:hypothetical protein n=1 Tax=Paracoccus hibiscisoli TaxID=2023261 RepID=UPI00391C7DA6
MSTLPTPGRDPCLSDTRKGWEQAGTEPADGSDGDALAKTINGLFEVEVIHGRRPWRTFEVVEYATPLWVGRFNNRRCAPIGSIIPAEAEADAHAALDAADMAASLTQNSPRSSKACGGP